MPIDAATSISEAPSRAATAHDRDVLHNLRKLQNGNASHCDERTRALQKLRVRQREAQEVVRAREVQNEQRSESVQSAIFLRLHDPRFISTKTSVTPVLTPPTNSPGSACPQGARTRGRRAQS